MGIKFLKVFHPFAYSYVFNRHIEFICYCDNYSATCRSIKFGQNNTRYLCTFVKFLNRP